MALNKTLSFDLELKPGGIPPIIHASQGDIGRMFKANIYWDGAAATSYVSGATVNLRGKKPDKTVFDYTATLAGSMVTFETTEQMTIISGPVECELVFSNDGDIIASANFLLIVEASPYDPDALSESDVEGLTDVLAGFQRLNRDGNGVIKIGDNVTASGTNNTITGFYTHDETGNTNGVSKLDATATAGLSEFEGEVVYTTYGGYLNNDGTMSPAGASTLEVYSAEYIPVTPGMKMVLNLKYSEPVNVWVAFVGFTKGLGSLGRTVVVNYVTTDNALGVYTVPANCYYVRVTYRTYGKLTAARLTYGGMSEWLQNNLESMAESGPELFGAINSDINTVYRETFSEPKSKLLSEWFEHGNLDGSGANQSYRDGSRIRTKSTLQFPYPAVIHTVGAQYILYYFQNGNYVSNTGWRNANDSAIYLNKNQEFKLLVTKNNAAPATQYDDVTEILALMRFYSDPPQKVNIKSCTDIVFERGHFEASTNTDTEYNGASRVRSNMVKLPYSVSVTAKTGSVLIACFDDKKTYLWQTAWRVNNPYIIPAGYYFRLLVSLTPGANTPAATKDILNGLEIKPLDDARGGSSPNIIYQCRNVNDSIFPPYSKYYIQAAAKNQYDRVRLNIRKTTDGYYFLCHDSTINNEARNPDGSALSETVNTEGHTLAELNVYDWGIKYGSRYAGMNVPLLEDAIKYAAFYNLGVSVEYSTNAAMTDDGMADTLEIFNKYGITDNLIVIDPVGNQIDKLKKFTDYNPRISAYVGAVESWYTAENVELIKTLQTQYNKVYVQLYPWGTMPSDSFITLAKENNFLLYNSITMSEAALLTENVFNKGYGLIEANNVFCIKDTVRNWANGLVDAGET